jgi:inhibitor of cysteine peptidase
VLHTQYSSPVSRDAVVEISISEFQGQPDYTGNVEIAVGGTLTLVLPSNPTTGYHWSKPAQVSDLSVMSQSDPRYVSFNAGGRPSAGGGGQETWVFRALKKGKCTVYLEYGPWNGGKKATRTVRLAVTVQ